MRLTFCAQFGTTYKVEAGVVPAHKARVALTLPVDFLPITAVLPFRMTQHNHLILQNGVNVPLELQETLRMKPGQVPESEDILESLAAVGSELFAPPKKDGGLYLDPFEQFMRSTLPSSREGGLERAIFTGQQLLREFTDRILIPADNVEFLFPEEIIINNEKELAKGDMSAFPIHKLEIGKNRAPRKGKAAQRVRKYVFRATRSGTVIEVTREHITIKDDRGMYHTSLVPPGFGPAPHIRVGRHVRCSASLLRLATDIDDLGRHDLTTRLLAEIKKHIHVNVSGTDYVRLSYVTKVPFCCALAGHNNGIHKNTLYACEKCGTEADVAPGVKPHELMACGRCKHVAPSEAFCKHRKCSQCPGAAVPALIGAKVLTGWMHYVIAPGRWQGIVQNPETLRWVRSFLRQLENVHIPALVKKASWISNPRSIRVS